MFWTPKKSIPSDPVPCDENRRQTEIIFEVFPEYILSLYNKILTMFLLDGEKGKKKKKSHRDTNQILPTVIEYKICSK